MRENYQMKQREIKIAGFTSDISPTDKPTISIYGEEGSGKTRFAATAPDPIGLLPLDLKSKRTFEPIAKSLGKYVIAPDKPFMLPTEAIALSLLDSDIQEQKDKIKERYTTLYRRVLEDAMKLAEHPDIATVVVDSNTAFWDWILYSHFGRRNRIDMFSRAVPNQDMQDFIAALKHKNLILLHRSADIYKETGEVDKQGKKISADTGKNKAEGCSKLGYFINCEIEMVSKDKSNNLDEKFKVRVRECQSNPLIEGSMLDDYGMKGKDITWDNLMTVINWEE
jgi:hypothetical protein